MGNISVLGSLSLEMYYTHLLLFFLVPILKDNLSFSLAVNILLFVVLYFATIGITLFFVFVFKSFAFTDLILYGKTTLFKNKSVKNL